MIVRYIFIEYFSVANLFEFLRPSNFVFGSQSGGVKRVATGYA